LKTPHHEFIETINALEEQRRVINAHLKTAHSDWARTLCPIKAGTVMTIGKTTDGRFHGHSGKVSYVCPHYGTLGWGWRCTGKIQFKNGTESCTNVDWDVPIEELRGV
jgi:hypothetical protein